MVSSDRERRHDYAESNRLQPRLIFRQELGISWALAGQLRVTIRSAFNRAFTEWPDLFQSPLLASAALDRLAHHAHQIVITGDSFRAKGRRRGGERSGPDSKS
jgi:hypothetical protein